MASIGFPVHYPSADLGNINSMPPWIWPSNEMIWEFTDRLSVLQSVPNLCWSSGIATLARHLVWWPSNPIAQIKSWLKAINSEESELWGNVGISGITQELESGWAGGSWNIWNSITNSLLTYKVSWFGSRPCLFFEARHCKPNFALCKFSAIMVTMKYSESKIGHWY